MNVSSTGIFLLNTLSRQKEELRPREAGKVSLYVCGVTPYDALHIGHARAFMAYDVLRRVLEWRGLEVTHIQNVTDVEDKIIERAAQLGVAPLELAQRFEREAAEDAQALGILPAHGYPRVSDNIEPIIAMVRALQDKGFAYARGGDVYFDVSKDPDYGKLSGQKLEELEAGARIEPGEGKDDPLDFALWKAAKPGEPSWDSPWGAGRPGWHIECSAMSLGILGEGFDIHGGARELVFPHHENEVAQSESFLDGRDFARVWWHCGELRVDGKKMSKSLGNFVTVRDGLKRQGPNVWRLLFLTTHPRSPLDYSGSRLQQAANAWARLENALLPRGAAGDSNGQAANGKAAEGEAPQSAAPQSAAARAFGERFEAALADDLNTPEALAATFDAVSEWHRGHDDALAHEARRALETLGFRLAAPDLGAGDDLTPRLLDLLISVRNEARARRDWKGADTIRNTLKEIGVALEDTPDGTQWKIERANRMGIE